LHSSICVALVDELLGDVAKLGVLGRRGTDEEGEGLVLVEAVPLHQDAEGLAHHLARMQRAVEILAMTGIGEGDRGMFGERLAIDSASWSTSSAKVE
jgi:hypothetical protein